MWTDGADCFVVNFMGDGFVVDCFVVCGCNLAVNCWMNHNLVVLDDCLRRYFLVDHWLVDNWLMDNWLMDNWLMDHWLVDHWLLDDLVNGEDWFENLFDGNNWFLDNMNGFDHWFLQGFVRGHFNHWFLVDGHNWFTDSVWGNFLVKNNSLVWFGVFLWGQFVEELVNQFLRWLRLFLCCSLN